MQKIILVLMIVSSLVCCTSNTNNETNEAQSTEDSSTPATNSDTNVAATTCYEYVKNGDTIRLSINTRGDTFTGDLLYQLKEKDRNKGALQGAIKGDTLIADYTFNAEGMQSVRQVAFLRQGNNLKEGFGEVKEKGNKMVFANPQAVQFTGFVLTPAACE